MTLQTSLPAIASQPHTTRLLSGWGRYPVASGEVCRPEKMSTLRQLAESAGAPTVLARGLGRSYGDAAVNAAGLTVLTQRLNRLLAFEETTGILRAEAGVSLDDLLSVFMPRGWMLPVVPGTKFITLGGAVAADIHGKNHHLDGSFARHVTSFQLLTGAGRLQCSRSQNVEAFFATAGGMGLTGAIAEVELRMKRVPSAFIKSACVPAANLQELMAAFAHHEEQHEFSVAWIDCLASGPHAGRGVLILGDFAHADELPVQLKADPLAWHPGSKGRFPLDLPEFVLNRGSISLFNEMFFRLHQRTTAQFVHADKFFFPLDSIHDWNRMYGKRGFVQYQCVLPPESSAEGLQRILAECARKGWGSFLAVLKRFGAGESDTQATLSFPHQGYTLALDFPVRDGLKTFLRQLDQIVISCGGRVYLAKDACLSAEDFRKMYPQWRQWKSVRDKLDVGNKFSSNLSRRLELTP